MRLFLTILSIFFIILFIFSCHKKDSEGFTIFKIKRGKHKSSSVLKFTNKKELSFKVRFDESCKYQTLDPVNQWDVNKLFGLSDGGSHIKNSARFGWRWVDGKLELLAFTHYNGDFFFEKITELEIGKEYDCVLTIGDKYTFISNGSIVTMDRYKNNNRRNYYLWPYFGGDEASPQDITIKIKY